jgi:hypothetical protein
MIDPPEAERFMVSLGSVFFILIDSIPFEWFIIGEVVKQSLRVFFICLAEFDRRLQLVEAY